MSVIPCTTRLSPIFFQSPQFKFQNPFLNLAIAHHRFLLENRSECFHVAVPESSYLQFLQTMQAADVTFHILPYSCYCVKDPDDDAKALLPNNLPHWHLMIVSTTPGSFMEHVWSKLEMDLIEWIHSPLHFIKTIGKVSRDPQWPKKGVPCPFTHTRMKRKLCSMALPHNYELILAMQYEKGLWNLLHYDAERILREEKQYKKQDRILWQVKSIPVTRRNRSALKVSRRFQPCKQPSKYFLYLMNGQKLYFDKSRMNGKKGGQIEKGNAYHYVKGKTLYIPNVEKLGEEEYEIQCLGRCSAFKLKKTISV